MKIHCIILPSLVSELDETNPPQSVSFETFQILVSIPLEPYLKMLPASPGYCVWSYEMRTRACYVQEVRWLSDAICPINKSTEKALF